MKSRNFDLSRFIEAQKTSYQTALDEIRSGRKRSHWIWYIFPQIHGLGFSEMSHYYALGSIGEARAYLQNEVLREHLLEITNALLDLQDDDIRRIAGAPDDMKIRSSMTLFREADPSIALFQQVLDKYFDGKPDKKTLQILEKDKGE